MVIGTATTGLLDVNPHSAKSATPSGKTVASDEFRFADVIQRRESTAPIRTSGGNKVQAPSHGARDDHQSGIAADHSDTSFIDGSLFGHSARLLGAGTPASGHAAVGVQPLDASNDAHSVVRIETGRSAEPRAVTGARIASFGQPQPEIGQHLPLTQVVPLASSASVTNVDRLGNLSGSLEINTFGSAAAGNDAIMTAGQIMALPSAESQQVQTVSFTAALRSVETGVKNESEISQPIPGQDSGEKTTEFSLTHVVVAENNDQNIEVSVRATGMSPVELDQLEASFGIIGGRAGIVIGNLRFNGIERVNAVRS